MKKKAKRKIRVSGLLFLILIVYLIATLVYYFFAMPIKSITITGNNTVTENEILHAASLDKKISLFSASTARIKKQVSSIPLINEVKVEKSILGKIQISVTENKILYLDSVKDCLVLSDGSCLKEYANYMGYPTLINSIPDKKSKRVIESFNKIDESILAMISQIEYSPDTYNNNVIDDERFILMMNDGNEIYINLVNIKKINKYQTIYANIDSKGVLYLDSSSDTYIFKKYSDM